MQSQLGSLHGINSALKSQLKAARERQEEAASVREDMLRAQLEELERTVGERDAQMEALAASTAQVIPAAATTALHELCCTPRPAVPSVCVFAHYSCCGMCRLERRCRCWWLRGCVPLTSSRNCCCCGKLPAAGILLAGQQEKASWPLLCAWPAAVRMLPASALRMLALEPDHCLCLSMKLVLVTGLACGSWRHATSSLLLSWQPTTASLQSSLRRLGPIMRCCGSAAGTGRARCGACARGMASRCQWECERPDQQLC